ncbi:hypothetical protein CMV_022230 [Castanea mollissima]|uniref:Uncharacterized protein n=1 Tax=Castanea mollissima TaxID=60419 RepID=A0A8J4QIP3_9ROSI|nr:hypothetical protein CMV_022230 [Castanea mollissima]
MLSGQPVLEGTGTAFLLFTNNDCVISSIIQFHSQASPNVKKDVNPSRPSRLLELEKLLRDSGSGGIDASYSSSVYRACGAFFFLSVFKHTPYTTVAILFGLTFEFGTLSPLVLLDDNRESFVDKQHGGPINNQAGGKEIACVKTES